MHQQITEKVVIYCLLALLFVCVWINSVVHKVLSNFYLRTWIFSIICAKYSFLCFNLQVLLTMDTSILVFQFVYWNMSTQVIPNTAYWAKWYTALAPTLIKHTWTSLSKAISEIAPIPSFTVPYIRPLKTLVVEEWSTLERVNSVTEIMYRPWLNDLISSLQWIYTCVELWCTTSWMSAL